ncbi:MAG: DHH family phosphoesterase [Bacilli bacterium]|nr:DHH family phosphoesterase [Bacilli bacterium]
MNKLISKFRLTLFVTYITELLIIAACVFAWFYNLFDVQNRENVRVIFIAILTVFLMFDAITVWVGIVRIGKKRQTNDKEAASLIGGDVQSAYNFARIGLAVVDNDGIVIWANGVFKEMQVDLIDTNIFEFAPTLKDLVNGAPGKTVKLKVKQNQYEVCYLSQPKMFVFNDRTEYEEMATYSREQATVLGILMIDNYNDVSSDTDGLADSTLKVRAAIADYCRDYGVLLRRVKSDTYFMVCNYTSLARMEKDQFSLLETVRSCSEKGEIPLTLSIGIAHDFPDIAKLNEMASDAIDVALSRGGDQVVVSHYGQELAFYGGKSTALENTSKVKVRSMADSVATIIRGSSNVYIMGHSDMDMDSLGAALGMMAICDWLKVPSKIVYTPKRAEKKTRLAFQSAFSRDVYDKMTISPEEAASQIKETTLLVMVDISVPEITMAPRLLDLSSKTMVIDHHRRGESFPEKPVLSYIDPSASSATELITEMIKYSNANPRIEIKPSFATIMLSGIFMDTSFFKSKSVGMRTFEAASTLKSYGADNGVADDYLKEEYEEYSLINKIIATMQTPYYGVVYCVSDDKDIIERTTLAKVANTLLQLKGVNACFVIGRTSDKVVRVSGRSDGSINVQLICEKMGGGGHFTASATAIPDLPTERVTSMLLSTLNQYLDSARNSSKEGD